LKALEEERCEAEEKERLADRRKRQDELTQRAIHGRLAAIINDRACDDYKRLLACQGDNPQALLDVIQAVRSFPPFHGCHSLCTSQALDSPTIDNSQKGHLMKALVKLSKTSGLYPDCLILNHAVTCDGDPIARGSFGDVWKGKILDREVAIKVLRVYQRSDVQKLLKVGFCFALNVNFI
jgi:hypothetical protein